MQRVFLGKCLVCSGMDGNCPNNWASAAEIQQKNEKPMVKTPCDPEPNCLVEGGRKVGGWSSLFYQFGNSGCAKVVLAARGAGRTGILCVGIAGGVGTVRHTVLAPVSGRGVLCGTQYPMLGAGRRGAGRTGILWAGVDGGGGAAPLTRRRGRRGIRNRACVGECMARAWRTLR